MGLFVLALKGTVEDNIKSAISNIKILTEQLGCDSYLLSVFAIPQLEKSLELLNNLELDTINFKISEIAQIQSETSYVLIKSHEDNVLEFEGYYKTLYITKYNDSSFSLQLYKTYTHYTTLKELISSIQLL